MLRIPPDTPVGACFAMLAIVGCGGGGEAGGDEAPESLTVYAGRSESLIGPILERFTQDHARQRVLETYSSTLGRHGKGTVTLLS